jgi:hypothetical protein
MDGPWGNLKLFTGDLPFPAEAGAPTLPPALAPSLCAVHPPTRSLLANQELIRPGGYRRAAPGLVPFSAAWYDELEQKRYQRHGVWLPAALEFGRHPGESLLLLGPGVGSDAVRYFQTGTPVTVGITPPTTRTSCGRTSPGTPCRPGWWMSAVRSCRSPTGRSTS